jgi:hypothetical protein
VRHEEAHRQVRLSATATGRAGRPGAATAYAELLTDQLRVLGPDHPNTLATRSNLPYWRGEAGA